jgi:hypothetical protein
VLEVSTCVIVGRVALRWWLEHFPTAWGHPVWENAPESKSRFGWHVRRLQDLPDKRSTVELRREPGRVAPRRGAGRSAPDPAPRCRCRLYFVRSVACSEPNSAVSDRKLIYKKRLKDSQSVPAFFTVPECSHVLAVFPLRDRIPCIGIILISKEPLAFQPLHFSANFECLLEGHLESIPLAGKNFAPNYSHVHFDTSLYGEFRGVYPALLKKGAAGIAEMRGYAAKAFGSSAGLLPCWAA